MSETQTLSNQNIRFYRRPWFFFLSILLFWPLSLILMWTGRTYYTKRGGQIAPMGRWVKAFISVGILLMGLLYFAALARDTSPLNGQLAEAQTGSHKGSTELDNNVSPDASPSGPQQSDQLVATAETNTIPKCDGPGIVDLIKERLANRGIEVVDIGKLREAASNSEKRLCIAAISFSTGFSGDMSYTLLLGPTGKTVIRVYPN